MGWALALVAATTHTAFAQTYPTRPVRVIVPYPMATHCVLHLVPISLSTRIFIARCRLMCSAIWRPQELARMIRDETAKWAKVVKDARLPVE